MDDIEGVKYDFLDLIVQKTLDGKLAWKSRGENSFGVRFNQYEIHVDFNEKIPANTVWLFDDKFEVVEVYRAHEMVGPEIRRPLVGGYDSYETLLKGLYKLVEQKSASQGVIKALDALKDWDGDTG